MYIKHLSFCKIVWWVFFLLYWAFKERIFWFSSHYSDFYDVIFGRVAGVHVMEAPALHPVSIIEQSQ